MRFIIILIALGVIVMVLKRLWQTSVPEKNRQIAAGRMVQCAHCGIYTPEDEATGLTDGKYYCSMAHRDAHLENKH